MGDPLRQARKSRKFSSAPLRAPDIRPNSCLVLQDQTISRQSAVDFFRVDRKEHAEAARLTEQFSTQNAAWLRMLECEITATYNGSDVVMNIRSQNAIGAIPLRSPRTAKPDLGLIVQPRFPWSGIGPMLAQMGWMVSPSPLRLPLLRYSERRVPLWVLSFMMLSRLKALTDRQERRFEMVEQSLPAPRGSVLWTRYASRSLPHARALQVPCSFPNLQDDRWLRGAIRFSVERHLQSLEGQREQGAFVNRLIDWARQILHTVRDAPTFVPTAATLLSWLQRPLRSQPLIDGLQAIEWTVEERGLAGASDLHGVPWTMRMEQFFEAWTESIFRSIAQQTGALVKTGRKRETTHPIQWQPASTGSQRSLIPDIWLEWDGATMIIDAKYKRHWEEMQFHPWSDVEEQLREDHRHDLLQVLAYANFAQSEKVIVCLVYPCEPDQWQDLRERQRLVHRAAVGTRARSVSLWLTAIPMATGMNEICVELASHVRAEIATT